MDFFVKSIDEYIITGTTKNYLYLILVIFSLMIIIAKCQITTLKLCYYHVSDGFSIGIATFMVWDEEKNLTSSKMLSSRLEIKIHLITARLVIKTCLIRPNSLKNA